MRAAWISPPMAGGPQLHRRITSCCSISPRVQKFSSSWLKNTATGRKLHRRRPGPPALDHEYRRLTAYQVRVGRVQRQFGPLRRSRAPGLLPRLHPSRDGDGPRLDLRVGYSDWRANPGNVSRRPTSEGPRTRTSSLAPQNSRTNTIQQVTPRSAYVTSYCNKRRVLVSAHYRTAEY